jgi:putative hemolysin
MGWAKMELRVAGAEGDQTGGQSAALTLSLCCGRYAARFAQGPNEVAAAQALRYRAFFPARGDGAGLDIDSFDVAAHHVLIWDQQDDDLVACYRIQIYQGAAVLQSYAGQFYDLSALAAFPGPLMELGRFCLHPERHDPDILRLAWAAMAHLVDQAGVRLLFGCSSFAGADPARHAVALGFLAGRIGPVCWRPGAKAAHRVDLAAHAGAGGQPQALEGIPALLRTYLGMGGWVSDHAVIDPQMNTLHVLTGVEIDKIPAPRARALRLIVADCLG